MLAPGFGLLFALLANVVTFRIFGGSYYEEHKWPKFSVLIMSGLACLVVGIVIKRKRARDAYMEQQAIDSLSPKHEIENLLAFSGPRDHLMLKNKTGKRHWLSIKRKFVSNETSILLNRATINQVTRLVDCFKLNLSVIKLNQHEMIILVISCRGNRAFLIHAAAA